MNVHDFLNYRMEKTASYNIKGALRGFSRRMKKDLPKKSLAHPSGVALRPMGAAGGSTMLPRGAAMGQLKSRASGKPMKATPMQRKLMMKKAGDTSAKKEAVKPVVNSKGAGLKMKDVSVTVNPVGKVNPVTGQHKKSMGVSINKKVAPNTYVGVTGKQYKKYSGKYPTGKSGTYAGLTFKRSF